MLRWTLDSAPVSGDGGGMLRTGCPRCTAPVTESAGEWTCGVHGSVPVLWRAMTPSYDAFAEHLDRADGDLIRERDGVVGADLELKLDGRVLRHDT